MSGFTATIVSIEGSALAGMTPSSRWDEFLLAGTHPVASPADLEQPQVGLADLPAGKHPVSLLLTRRKGRAVTRNSLISALRTSAQLLHEACDVPLALGLEHEPIEMALDWTALDELTAARFVTEMRRRFPNYHTSHHRIVAVRGIVTAMGRCGIISQTTTYQLLDALKATQRSTTTLRAGRYVTCRERGLMLQAAQDDASPRGMRDAAMLSVLCTTGMRACEVIDLDLSDYDRVNRRLTVKSKGGGQRDALLKEADILVIDRWVDARGSAPGALFGSFKGGGATPTYKRGCAGTANAVVARRARQAQITEPVTSHDLRRSLVTDLLRITDLAATSQIVGHTDARTTLSYDRAPEELMRQAIEQLDFGIASGEGATR